METAKCFLCEKEFPVHKLSLLSTEKESFDICLICIATTVAEKVKGRLEERRKSETETPSV